jgi:hypothetical protein
MRVRACKGWGTSQRRKSCEVIYCKLDRNRLHDCYTRTGQIKTDFQKAKQRRERNKETQTLQDAPNYVFCVLGLYMIGYLVRSVRFPEAQHQLADHMGKELPGGFSVC